MEGKEFSELSDKDKEKVLSILNEGEITEKSEIEDDAIVAQKIKNGEIMSVKLIEKFKLLTERKLKKTEKEVVLDFGKTIEIERISDDKIKIRIGKEEVIVTDKEAARLIINGFADKKFVSVTGVCKKETWEKKEKKDSIKGLVVAGIAVIAIGIPIIVNSCNKQISGVNPEPVPTETISETVDYTEPVPTTIPVSVDPTIEPSEKVSPEVIFKFFDNIKWVPGTTQQYEWSSIEDSDVLGIDNPKSADNINKEMQENVKLLNDIESFRSKYEGRTIGDDEYDIFIAEASDLMSRAGVMLDNSYEAISLAEVLNQKVIDAQVPHLGDLETESETRKIILSGIEALKEDLNDLTKAINVGGITR